MNDDDEQITEVWLLAEGWDRGSLSMSRLIPPIGNGAIVEVALDPPADAFTKIMGVGECDGWTISLYQGLPDGDDQKRPDDQITITSVYPTTRGQLRRFLAGIGA